jgi:pimeloyl-[acyl-carrier protein] methyl ester esterase
VTLYTETSGQGEPLVLWHGWGMNLRVFDGLRAALAGKYRLIATDLPGHGRSPWPAVADDARQLQLLLDQVPEGATLLGWSLGGQWALRAAAAAPQRIRRLVLVCTTPRFVQSADWPHGLPAAVVAEFAARLTGHYRQTLHDFLELQVRGSSNAEAVRATLLQALLIHGEAKPAALEAGLQFLATQDLRRLVTTITVPTLLISGQRDRVTPPAAAAALARLLPDCRLLELARAAHVPFLSHPAPFLEALQAFLASGAAAPVSA